MSKRIEVFYNSENGAQDAATSIQKYKVTEVRVEKIPENEERDTVLIPAGNIGAAQSGHPGMFASLKELKDTLTKDGKASPDYILQFFVEEEDKKPVLEEIKKTDGYIDKETGNE
ncbi:hypothetical protein [Alkalicoccus halolimnae]|uniref:General stress protein 17M-like domain-containing protein n=1 Tax=Alkalicoccus halolimnae TaxID=1667239 RepID=A0A5C7F290_9BACI|nr:hypothetical protein [Alkalicoccus halolimnae]TXF83999.1 hypothetical protein FTX54_11990 [Alkalicoccus halolimnae]